MLYLGTKPNNYIGKNQDCLILKNFNELKFSIIFQINVTFYHSFQK